MRLPVSAFLLSFAVFGVFGASAASARPGHVLAANSEHTNGATVTNIIYESVGLHGEPIKVSGFVVVPDGPVPPGGRPIVAWAHETVGVTSKCGPSLSHEPLWTVKGLNDMVQRGWIVTSTDYQGLGLGSGSPHPFLVGISEGRGLLDSVRAAREIAGPTASDHYALWGFSQGGHAALFAGGMARRYAPELHLDGVAVAEAPTDLGALIEKDLNTPVGKIFTSYALYAWSKVYHIPLDPVLAPPQKDDVIKASQDCLYEFGDAVDLAKIAKSLKDEFLQADLNTVSPWRQIIKLNSPPAFGPVPVFFAQGTLDQVVNIKVSSKYVAKLCARGDAVDYFIMPGAFHATAMLFATKPAVAWMAGRFAGEPAPNTCTP